MNSASTGAWPLTDPSGSQKKYLLNVFCNHATGTNIVCLVDLLVTIGGIGANTTTATDTSGSPALKRYVDGIGNMMILECTVQLGTTASNVTITYNGTSGNSHSSGALAMTTTPLITFRTDPQSLGGLVTQMASGDAGVKKITAVQFSAAMGAGTVAAHIYRPLVLIPNITAATNWAERPVPNIMGGIQELLVGNSDSSHTAFLTFFVNTSGASTGVQQYYIQTINA
jgi:hypothetical protein